MSTKTDELMRLAEAYAVEWSNVDGWSGACKYAPKLDNAYAALGTLRSAIQEVVKDAERYRWLRANDLDTDAISDGDGEFYSGDALDAAIDAAMKPEAP